MKIKGFVHYQKYEWQDEPRWVLFSGNMESTDPANVCICECEVDFDIPADFDPTSRQIAILRAEQQKIRAEANVKAENIEAQIQKLLCIEHKPELPEGAQ